MHNLYIDQAEALLTQRREAVQDQSRCLQQLTCKWKVPTLQSVHIRSYFAFLANTASSNLIECFLEKKRKNNVTQYFSAQ